MEAWVEFEMLEGMANHQARAVQARAGGLLLYAPVVRAEDFHSAIAYLVRRLDENTAPDNFLRHVFGLEPGSPEWELERDRFLGAFDLVDELSDAPRRTQDSRRPRRPRSRRRAILGALRERARHGLGGRRPTGSGSTGCGPSGGSGRAETVPLQIGGDVRGRRRAGRGARPLAARRASPIATRLADRAQVSRALDAAPRRAGGLGEPARDGAAAPARRRGGRARRGGAAIWSAR